MQLAICLYSGTRRVVVRDGETTALVCPQETPDPIDLVGDGAALSRAREGAAERVPIADLTFLPPVASPEKILCVGLNYAAHAQESARAQSPYPSLFARFPSSQVGHGQPIVAPAISHQFDYEGELAVIIGKPAWRVSQADAMDHVAGYSCFAENSVRDFQKHARQITAGKNFTSSGAFGPWLSSADSVGDLSTLTLTTRLNGMDMQHAMLGSMIFSVPELIAYISQFTQLVPGDVIATGTPAGVGASRNPPVWMKPGDTLEVEIEGIGCLTNPVVAEGG